MTDRSPDIGTAVRSARRARNISQRGLGRLVGRSQQWVAAVETGRIALTLEAAIEIAQALNVDVATLVGLPQERVS